MGNPKQKWTAGEEEALKAGIAKHGAGKWKLIQKDPEFNKFLHSRSNIDLKDKWRNMSAAVQGSRDKSRVSKPKPSPDAPATPSAPVQTLAVLPVPIAVETPVDHVKDDSGKDLPDANNALRYEMIFEVLKERNGMDVGSIFAHIEKRSDEPLPHNFRKHLGAKLRRLVQQEKLEKVDNLYRLKDTTTETKVSVGKENLARPQSQNLSAVYSKIGESLEEAAKTAAYKVVEAENKSAMAAEAVKDFEKISKMAEETDSILQLAKEILDRCTCGEILIAS